MSKTTLMYILDGVDGSIDQSKAIACPRLAHLLLPGGCTVQLQLLVRRGLRPPELSLQHSLVLHADRHTVHSPRWYWGTCCNDVLAAMPEEVQGLIVRAEGKTDANATVNSDCETQQVTKQTRQHWASSRSERDSKLLRSERCCWLKPWERVCLSPQFTVLSLFSSLIAQCRAMLSG
jgi:hypothetical protein